MLVKISKNKINVQGGESNKLDNGDELILFRSPNHPYKKNENFKLNNNFKEYASQFKHDSFIYIDNKKEVVRFLRDWPGNIPVFYYYSQKKEELIISDNIHILADTVGNTKPSKHGLKLFITDRKHFHSYTIYDEIFLLHPGLYIELDKKTFKITNNWWYKPFKNITITDKEIAKKNYLDTLDATILRLVPKDKPAALMFSGGSDSTLLLDRMVKLGYNKIDLFTICVNGETIQHEYANEKAKIFNMEVIPIFADKENIFEGWKELFKLCYHYLSDLRIDGIFSPSVQVIKKIKDYYNGEPSSLVWGSQYAIASPMVSTKAIFFKFYPIFILIKLAKHLKFIKKRAYKFALNHLRSAMLQENLMSKESLLAFKDLYLTSFDEINSTDQLINLFLSTDYNHLKHWWMDWRNKVSSNFYKNSVNIFPFHDREFQESTMSYSLKVRIGGFRNLFKMPNSFKNLFFSLFDSNIPVSSIKRGNHATLPEYFSLFKNENFYNFLTQQLNQKHNIKLVEFLVKELDIYIPSSYNDLLKLNTIEVEQLTGIIFLATRLKEDGVSFEN
tara:strand:- start:223 stop:1899 length:1677 start_codon:yes stop_codon:yes gene_type:complete